MTEIFKKASGRLRVRVEIFIKYMRQDVGEGEHLHEIYEAGCG
jgi:hypothetical protein